MTIRKLLVSNAIRNYAYRGTALQMSQRRFAANSSDPLDLDGDEIDEEELLQKHSQQQQQQQQQQQEDEVPQEDSADTLVQQRVYTFGSVYNGRTGNNISSTLGLTGSVPSQKPQHIEFFDNYRIKKISSIHKHYLALTEEGYVFAWGSNNYGQLGCGDDKVLGLSMPLDRQAPVLVRTEDGEPLKNIIDVSAGKFHSAAVDSEGRIFTWGKAGRLGKWFSAGHLLGYTATKGFLFKFSPFARPIAEFGPENGMEVESENNPFQEGKSLNPKAVQVACGAVHTVARDEIGRAWTWGYGDWGRLGQEDLEDRTRPTPVLTFLDEKSGLPRTSMAKVGACESISTFLTTEGGLFTCGRDTTRQLGIEDNQGVRGARFVGSNIPQLVSLSNVSQATTGSHSALAVGKGGIPYYWGSQETRGPQIVGGLGRDQDQKISKISIGSGHVSDHRAFLSQDGILYMSGGNIFGQSLADTSPREENPSFISGVMRYLRSFRSTRLSTISVQTQCPQFFLDKKVVDVCCGHSSTVVVTEDITESEAKEREENISAIFEEATKSEEKKKSPSKKRGWF